MQDKRYWGYFARSKGQYWYNNTKSRQIFEHSYIQVNKRQLLITMFKQQMWIDLKMMKQLTLKVCYSVVERESFVETLSQELVYYVSSISDQ